MHTEVRKKQAGLYRVIHAGRDPDQGRITAATASLATWPVCCRFVVGHTMCASRRQQHPTCLSELRRCSCHAWRGAWSTLTGLKLFYHSLSLWSKQNKHPGRVVSDAHFVSCNILCAKSAFSGTCHCNSLSSHAGTSNLLAKM